MSLLTIVTKACSRLSLAVPTTVMANTNAQVVQLKELAQEEGKNLASKVIWKALTAEKTFTTTAAAVQTGAVPSDFDYLIPDTMFNRTARRRIDGPISADEWQVLQAAIIGRVFSAFRFRGSNILITPTPTAGETVAYEYVTKNWCQSSVGAGQSVWTADTDTALIDEELHTQGIVWRFLKMRGMDHQDAFRDYTQNVLQAIMREGSRPRLYLDGTNRILRAPNRDYFVST